MTPKRIQRKREKGWRMPERAIYVGRGSKWGNPFPVGKPGPLGRQAIDNEGAVGFFRDMLDDPEMIARCGYPVESISELRGKDLACWCGPKDECHADVLLALANVDDVKGEAA